MESFVTVDDGQAVVGSYDDGVVCWCLTRVLGGSTWRDVLGLHSCFVVFQLESSQQPVKKGGNV